MDKKKEQYALALEKKKQAKEKEKLEEEAKKFTRVKYKYKLFEDVISYNYITSPICTAVASTHGTISLPYFHHVCDWVDDVGWGRGYRVVQTMCSYVLRKRNTPQFPVPCIRDIQKTLVRIGHKPPSFERSKEPIGALEGSLIIETLYNVKSKLMHVGSGPELKKYNQNFYLYYGFSMLSSHNDEDSRGVAGAFFHYHPNYICLLLVDPSYNDVPKSSTDIRKNGYVYWKKTDDLDINKSYTICSPSI